MLDVFIIGGGPAGALAALLLGSQDVGPAINARPGTQAPSTNGKDPSASMRVTLVEGGLPPAASLSGGRSFSYLIGPRGAAALSRIPNLLPAVRAAGVPSRPLTITSLAADGKVAVNPDLGRALETKSAPMEPGTWLHRNAFMGLLYKALDDAMAAEGGGSVCKCAQACHVLAWWRRLGPSPTAMMAVRYALLCRSPMMMKAVRRALHPPPQEPG